MGMTDADSIDASYTGTADTQKRFPTAIYLSFDLKATSINSGTTNGITDIVSFDCWSILRTYKEQGRYYSSGLDATGTYPYLGYDNQHWNSFDTAQKVRQCFVFNEIIGLMNPTYMNDVNGDGSADLQDILVISQQHKLWNGDNVVYKNQEDFRYYEEYVSDYRYNQTFAAQDAPTIIPVTLVDTISDNFVIAPTDPLSWSSVDTGGSDTTNSGTKLTPTVDYGSNTVNIQYNKYHDGDTVTITVDVILNDAPEQVTWNDWFDANDGDAVLTAEQNGETATETVSSPIAHVEEASFTATKIYNAVWNDYAEFFLSTRGQNINNRLSSEREADGKGDFTNTYGDWFAYRFGDKDSYYYRGAFMDCVQAVRFMATRPTSDMTNLFAEGQSQGGAFTYAAAALSGYTFRAIAPGIAFMGDYPDYFNIVNWPAYVARENQGTMTDDELFAFLSYFDTKNLATAISCPVIACIGLQDDVCPPHTNIAPYNNLLSADKQLLFNPELGHQAAASWYTDFMAFFAARIQTTTTAIDQTINEKIAKCGNEKILSDGQLFIIRNNNKYNANGTLVK